MSIIKSGVKLAKRGILLSATLFAAFFTFYFVFSLHVLPKVFDSSLFDLSVIQAIFSFTIAGTLVFSGFFHQRLARNRVFLGHSVLASVFTVLLLFAGNHILSLLLVLLIGVFFSFGLSAFFVHFWDTTSGEERGRVGGLIGLSTLPFYFVVNMISTGDLSRSGAVLLATFISLVPLALLFRPRKQEQSRRDGIHPEKRTVLLYALPWIIFSLVNATFARTISLTAAQLMDSSSFGFIILLQTVAALVGTLIGGVVSDLFGRRLALTFSITVYGVGMALSGLTQSVAFAFFAFAAEGLSWGILLTLYCFVIWGDLSNRANSAKMYAIGLAVFFIASALGPISSVVTQIPAVSSAFIGCMLIFLSNVPIALAPELQSSDFLEKVRMSMHIRSVKKAIKQLRSQG